ncbi:MAG: hypothetical protein AAFZ38_01955 [Myxococcota bacterium]
METIRSLFIICAIGTVPLSAHAVCGTFDADDGDNLIIVGEGIIGDIPIPFTSDMAVCWLDEAGSWHYEYFPACSKSSPDRLRINALGGNDAVIPMVREHYSMDFVCPALTGDRALYPLMTHPGDFNNVDHVTCREWNGCKLFEAGLEIHGGEGEDRIYGSSGDDLIFTNGACAVGGYWRGVFICLEYAADFAGDLVCAGTGADTIYGDKTSNEQLWYEIECLDGGEEARIVESTDACYGQDAQYDYAPIDHCEVLSNLGPAEVNSSYHYAPVDQTCCRERAEPGCAAPWQDRWVYEQRVCDADPGCCDTAWSARCVDQYIAVAGSSACPAPDAWHWQRNDCYDACRNLVTYDGGSSQLPPVWGLLEEYTGRSWWDFHVGYCDWNTFPGPIGGLCR